MSSQLPIRVEENLQSCIVIVFEPFAGSECDIHDLVQLLVSLICSCCVCGRMRL